MSKDEVIVVSDYSWLELRVLAELAAEGLPDGIILVEEGITMFDMKLYQGGLLGPGSYLAEYRQSSGQLAEALAQMPLAVPDKPERPHERFLQKHIKSVRKSR